MKLSLVAKLNSVEVMILIAINSYWSLYQLDVKNNFLHGDLQEEVYMSQAPMFEVQDEVRKVCKLNIFLYGLISSTML